MILIFQVENGCMQIKHNQGFRGTEVSVLSSKLALY